MFLGNDFHDKNSSYFLALEMIFVCYMVSLRIHSLFYS
jgi:hypothetical protein